jgi:CRISPR-associated protein Csd2
VQVAFASSVEKILPLEISITRMAATTADEKKKRDEGDDAPSEARQENRTMGRKFIVPYGLYRAHMFVNAKLAERTGFSQEDLDLLFEALRAMFEHDRSAARGEMASRRAVAFRHASALGGAPAHELFKRVTVRRKVGDTLYEVGDDRLGNYPPARRFEDYEVAVNDKDMPEGVDIVNIL